MDGKLKGARVLVLEDEPLIALDIAETLARSGAEIVRAHSSLDALRRLSAESISAAALDVRLGPSDDCETVCAELERRHLPFLFYTGYHDVPVLQAYKHVPLVEKPAVPDVLPRILSRLCEKPAAA